MGEWLWSIEWELVGSVIRGADVVSNLPMAAIIYDLDGTLTEGDCAQHALMRELGITNPTKFWKDVKKETKERDGDEILTYLGALALAARQRKKRDELKVAQLKRHGSKIPLFPGVADWFNRVNRYASGLQMELQHYVVSSGLEEMILGTSIAQEFKRAFGCRYHYDEKAGHAKWPAVAINYTTKTQYIFRINKGILNSYDNESVNKHMLQKERPIPFPRIIYIGDGDTDIPSMKLVKDKGGCSIAVFDENKWNAQGTTAK